MRVYPGTSGFSYDEWTGSFYPEGLATAARLRFYGERLPAVEINNTFYRMPRADVLAGWYQEVPSDFRFVLKASQRITHLARLRDVGDSVAYLFRVSAILQDKLGPTLFQLPPNLKRDVPLLRDFLALLPAPAALEFRHDSWFVEPVYAALADHRAALVGGDPENGAGALPLLATARFGYLRLRAPDYDDAALSAWAERVREMGWDEAYVFFKHDEHGPAFAQRFDALFPGSRVPARPGVVKARPPSHPELPATGDSRGAGVSPPEPAAAPVARKARGPRKAPPGASRSPRPARRR